MSDQTPATPTRKTGRGVKIALAVSLALNLLVVGLVGGAVLGRRDDPGAAPAIRTLGLGPFTLALSGEGRDDVRRRIEAGLPEISRDRMQIGGSLRAVQRALLADPFDRDAAAAALARSREAAAALQAYGHGALLDTLDAMSPAERAEVAERLGRAMRRISPRSP